MLLLLLQNAHVSRYKSSSMKTPRYRVLYFTLSNDGHYSVWNDGARENNDLLVGVRTVAANHFMVAVDLVSSAAECVEGDGGGCDGWIALRRFDSRTRWTLSHFLGGHYCFSLRQEDHTKILETLQGRHAARRRRYQLELERAKEHGSSSIASPRAAASHAGQPQDVEREDPLTCKER